MVTESTRGEELAKEVWEADHRDDRSRLLAWARFKLMQIAYAEVGADEAAGVVWIVLCETLNSFRDDGGTSLHGYVRRYCCGHMRFRESRPILRDYQPLETDGLLLEDILEEDPERGGMEELALKLRSCSNREAHVLLAHLCGRTLDDISDSLGCTRERVRQIQFKAITGEDIKTTRRGSCAVTRRPAKTRSGTRPA